MIVLIICRGRGRVEIILIGLPSCENIRHLLKVMSVPRDSTHENPRWWGICIDSHFVFNEDVAGEKSIIDNIVVYHHPAARTSNGQPPHEASPFVIVPIFRRERPEFLSVVRKTGMRFRVVFGQDYGLPARFRPAPCPDADQRPLALFGPQIWDRHVVCVNFHALSPPSNGLSFSNSVLGQYPVALISPV